MNSGRQTEGSEGRGLWGWVSLVVRVKEGTDCTGHWVLHADKNSWNTASRTEGGLYDDSHNKKEGIPTGTWLSHEYINKGIVAHTSTHIFLYFVYRFFLNWWLEDRGVTNNSA